ncbi:MAPEG family protein [Shewanella sp. A25]|nr:MAPEG family protein [Shewanella shenzhenensis]
MNTLLICLFIAMLLPYLTKMPVAFAMAKAGGYDNNHPRSQQAQLTGFGARAVAGHQNAFESLLIFGLAVVTLIAAGKVNVTAEYFAIGHVLARVVYQVLYLINLGTLRSLSWFAAIFCSFGVFFQAF